MWLEGSGGGSGKDNPVLRVELKEMHREAAGIVGSTVTSMIITGSSSTFGRGLRRKHYITVLRYSCNCLADADD